MSQAFNFTKVYQAITRIRFEIENFDYPLKGQRDRSGLFASIDRMLYRKVFKKKDILADTHESQIIDGFSLVIHDPFGQPSVDSMHIQTVPNQTINFFVTPELIEIEDSLIDFEPDK